MNWVFSELFEEEEEEVVVEVELVEEQFEVEFEIEITNSDPLLIHSFEQPLQTILFPFNFSNK